jgi:hypothetical protein
MNQRFDRETRGICLSAPKNSEDTDLFVRFIDEWLAPKKCSLLVLLIRYRYQFETRPECASPDALSKENMIKIKEACKRNNIKLVPKMNLMGHQSEKTKDSMDGLLKSHPEFDETPDTDEVFYCRSLCPTHPEIKPVIFDLMDELVEVCESEGLHIGCDEVFDIGLCDRCKNTGKSTADIFANWVNALASHLRDSGKQTYMWGDRLLSEKTGYGTWEASGNGTQGAINKIAKDIVICDWHYENLDAYVSVDIFQSHGFDFLVCPWRHKDNAVKFLEYAKKHGGDKLKGFMATTWHSSAVIAKHMLDIEKSENDTVKNLAMTLEELFG